MPFYEAFTKLENAKQVDLANQNWTLVTPVFRVDKKLDDSSMEVEYGGEASYSSLNAGGIAFEARLAGRASTIKTSGLLLSNGARHLSFKSIYTGLPKGTCEIAVYARLTQANASATNVRLSPANLGGAGAIIVTEAENLPAS